MKRLIGLFVLLAACSKSAPSAPSSIDPTVLVTNLTALDTAQFTWSGSNYVGGVVSGILPGQSACVHIDALPYSAYFHTSAVGPENVYETPTGVALPRFDPAQHPYWTVTIPDVVDTVVGAILMRIQEVPASPC